MLRDISELGHAVSLLIFKMNYSISMLIGSMLIKKSVSFSSGMLHKTFSTVFVGRSVCGETKYASLITVYFSFLLIEKSFSLQTRIA